MWEFPGGKLEEGESLTEAARRELEEELNLTIEAIGETLLVVHDAGSPFQIEFVEVSAVGERRANEHDEILWSTPTELCNITLAPSDRIFAMRLNCEDKSIA